MPMNRRLYPPDWEDIARRIKDRANWTCEECGRPCRKPGETWEDLEERIPDAWAGDYWDIHFVSYDESVLDMASATPKRQRFTLTVAHLDHDPANCADDNLKAWCSVCHCRYDLLPSSMERKRQLAAERRGQLRLI